MHPLSPLPLIPPPRPWARLHSSDPQLHRYVTHAERVIAAANVPYPAHPIGAEPSWDTDCYDALLCAVAWTGPDRRIWVGLTIPSPTLTAWQLDRLGSEATLRDLARHLVIASRWRACVWAGLVATDSIGRSSARSYGSSLLYHAEANLRVSWSSVVFLASAVLGLDMSQCPPSRSQCPPSRVTDDHGLTAAVVPAVTP